MTLKSVLIAAVLTANRETALSGVRIVMKSTNTVDVIYSLHSEPLRAGVLTVP